MALTSREAQVVDAMGNTRPALMPVTQVFVYHVEAGSKVGMTLGGASSAWQPQAQAGIANLTVATGLPLDAQDPTGHHAHAALAEVTSYYSGLSLQILNTGAELQTGEVDGLPDNLRNRNLPMARGERPARLEAAVFRSGAREPRLQRVSELIDCQAGGVGVHHP